MNLREITDALEQGVEHQVCKDRSFRFAGMTREYYIPDLMQEVLGLLKAQEPVEPVKVNRYMDTDENGDWYVPETYDCGNCGVELHDKANYCHLCGRAVKWE